MRGPLAAGRTLCERPAPIGAGLTRLMARYLVTPVTRRRPPAGRAAPADTARERSRLWLAQTLFAAAQTGGAVALVWLAVTLGGGPSVAAGLIATGLAALALGTAPAAWVAARAPRRTLLWASQGVAALALAGTALAAPGGGVAVLTVGAALLGASRATFDAAATDVLHQLVAPERQHDACRDLTARFTAGQALGLAGALIAGYELGPAAAVLTAAALAAAGASAAGRHHPDIDLRTPGRPSLARALARGARRAARPPLLRATLIAGAVAVAIGGAQAAVLIVWLHDDVGLRGALVPALLAGLIALRLGMPLVTRLAARARAGAVLASALATQSAGALVARAADGWAGSASAYALTLTAGALLGALVNRIRAAVAPPELAPAVGLAAGAAWAIAAGAGAAAGAALAGVVGLSSLHLWLAATAGAAALAAAAPLARVPGRRAPAGGGPR
ncbi:MAG: Transrane secretion effector [Miltoncostaeaceae bacterium]|nr:Transrane secretion effector [Miltoncostaeaceae bacterium]